MQKRRTLADIENEMFKIYIGGEFFDEFPYRNIKQLKYLDIVKFTKRAEEKLKKLHREYKITHYYQWKKYYEKNGETTVNSTAEKSNIQKVE